ncbi:MAG: hypothetical protein MPW16_18360 [Candidatus Manganitrophus sp.]|nr:MAG: hypothetical protein MPW16_18360 [Candidatus Manganitrophus sp.]
MERRPPGSGIPSAANVGRSRTTTAAKSRFDPNALETSTPAIIRIIAGA